MKLILIFFQFLIQCSSLQGANRTVTADDITYITENYPPYSSLRASVPMDLKIEVNSGKLSSNSFQAGGNHGVRSGDTAGQLS